MTFFDEDEAAADPAARRRAAAAPGPEMAGKGWALAFALALLAAFVSIMLIQSLRARLSPPLEIIVQQPVPADNAPPDNRQEATAPDPGDNP